MSITIKDIARLTNLSTATVSRAINNKPDVSSEAKTKVRSVMKEYNYNPNSIARSLVMKCSNTIGLILPDITNSFFPEVALGVENQAKELGYSVILYDTNQGKVELNDAVEFLMSKQVDGIIIVQWSESKNTGFLKEIVQERKFPIVAIDRKAGPYSVMFNNYESGLSAVNYLCGMGHRKIAYIGGEISTVPGKDRYEGYLHGMEKAGIAPVAEWIKLGKFTHDSGIKCMKEILQSKEHPTAVVCANDLIAIGVYDAIFDAGLSIPEDISVIGHDNISFSSFIRPGLTTVAVPRYELGQACINVLNCQIKKEVENIHPVELHCSLVIRQSVARLEEV